MISVKEYEAIRDKARRARTEADRAQGVLDKMREKIRIDFDTDNPDELLAVMEQLVERIADEETTLKKKVRKFEALYEQNLGGD